MKATKVGQGHCPVCGKLVSTYRAGGRPEERYTVHNPPNWGAEEKVLARLAGQSQVCGGSRQEKK